MEHLITYFSLDIPGLYMFLQIIIYPGHYALRTLRYGLYELDYLRCSHSIHFKLKQNILKYQHKQMLSHLHVFANDYWLYIQDTMRYGLYVTDSMSWTI